MVQCVATCCSVIAAISRGPRPLSSSPVCVHSFPSIHIRCGAVYGGVLQCVDVRCSHFAQSSDSLTFSSMRTFVPIHYILSWENTQNLVCKPEWRGRVFKQIAVAFAKEPCNICVCACVCACVFVCMYMHIRNCKYLYVCTSVDVYIYMHTCMIHHV